MQDVRTRHFSAGEVAAAADITMSTLQNWIKRGVIIGHRTIEGGGERGRHRRFSWFNVMEICTAAALVRAGVTDLSVAFAAGVEFGHTGPGPLPGRPERQPAMPYDLDHGRTLLFIAGDRKTIAPWQPGKDILSEVRFELGRPEAYVVIDMLDLFDRACAALEIHPQAAMDAAYSPSQEG